MLKLRVPIVRAVVVFGLVLAGLMVPTAARATGPADITNIYVATSGSTATGGSCANPDFVGTDQTPIQAAVDAAIADSGSAHTINLCEGTWNFTEEVLVPVKVETLTIQGAGADKTILDGGDMTRILHVNGTAEDAALSPVVVLNDMAFRNGYAGNSTSGGAVFVDASASLYVSRSVFTDNNSTMFGGAIALFGRGNPWWTGGTFTIDSSYFANNTANVDGGAVMNSANAFPGLTVRNSTFYRNTARVRAGGALSAPFASAEVYGSTFVDNRAGSSQTAFALGVRDWGNEAIGNIIANRIVDGLLCGGENNWLIEGNVVTDPACADNGSATVVSYESLELHAPDPRLAVPFLTIGASSSARDIWAATSCLAEDIAGNLRPTTGNQCDAGAWERPDSWGNSSPVVTHLTYTQLTASTAAVATSPVTADGSTFVRFLSSTPTQCDVDVITGAVTGYVNGNCVVSATIFSDSSRDATSDSATVTLSGTASLPAVTGAYAAVRDPLTGVTYSVAASVPAIARTTSDGELNENWVALGTGAAPNNIVMSADGTLYVTDQGRSRVVRVSNVRSETPTLDDNWADLTAGYTPNSLALDEQNSVMFVGILGSSDEKHTVAKVVFNETGTATSVQPNWAVLPGVGPTDIAFDPNGYVWTAGWYAAEGSISRVTTSTGETTTVFAPTGSGLWPYTMSVDPAGNVYSTNYNGTVTRIPLGDLDVIEWQWADLAGTDGLLTGIVADTSGIYVAHQGTDSIVRLTVDADGAPVITPRWRSLGSGSKSQLMSRDGTQGILVANSGSASVARFAYAENISMFTVENGTLTVDAHPNAETVRQADLGTAANGLGINMQLVVPQGAVETVTKFAISTNSSSADLLVGRLNVTITAVGGGETITAFAEPIEIRITGSEALLPAFSTDGAMWNSIIELPETFTLTAGQAGYRRQALANGTQYRIFTTHLTSFALQSEQAPLTFTAATSSVTAGSTTSTAVSGGSGSGGITYSSSDSAVCSVSNSGVISGASAGVCVVTATKLSDGTFRAATASVNITVVAATPPGGGNGGNSGGGSGGAPSTSGSVPPIVSAGNMSLIASTLPSGSRQLLCTAPTWSRDAQSVEFTWQGIDAPASTVTSAPWATTVDVPLSFGGKVSCDVVGYSSGSTARAQATIEIAAPTTPAPVTQTTSPADASTAATPVQPRAQDATPKARKLALKFKAGATSLSTAQKTLIKSVNWQIYRSVRIDSGDSSSATAQRVKALKAMIVRMGFKGSVQIVRQTERKAALLIRLVP